MIICLMCLWAYGAHVAMQVSDPEGYTNNSRSLLAESESQGNTIFRSRKIGLSGYFLHVPRYQRAPSGTNVWLQHTRGPRSRRGTIGQ